MKPDITLCILTYNRSKDVENTIKTYLHQTYQKSELVIIDDASPDDTEKKVKKWLPKDRRIRYIRNKKNLGLSRNFAQSFNHCKGKYVVFLGDDDVLISLSALEEYIKIFKRYKPGVVRSRQVLFRSWKIFQAVPLANNGQEVIYKKGKDAFNMFVYDTASIAGLGFANTKTLKELALTLTTSMYPQVELAAKMLLFYKGIQINKYCIGVQSHKGQLNVISYNLAENKTNILDDFSAIFSRVKQLAKEKGILLPSHKVLIHGVIAFLPIFLPYNTLKNGKRSSFDFIKVILKYDNFVLKKKIFIISLLMILLPNILIRTLLDIINPIKLGSILNKSEIKMFNEELQQYC